MKVLEHDGNAADSSSSAIPYSQNHKSGLRWSVYFGFAFKLLVCIFLKFVRSPRSPL